MDGSALDSTHFLQHSKISAPQIAQPDPSEAKNFVGERPACGPPFPSEANAMNKMKSPPPLQNGPRLPTLSPAGYKVLRLLEKGCAYQARGAWRFRGSHSPTNGRTLIGLLAKGLAERVEIDRHAQVRITMAGRSVSLEGPRQQSADHSRDRRTLN